LIRTAEYTHTNRMVQPFLIFVDWILAIQILLMLQARAWTRKQRKGLKLLTESDRWLADQTLAIDCAEISALVSGWEAVAVIEKEVSQIKHMVKYN
jgi:hypothetical protein